MSQFDLTDEQRRIQEMARQFTADAITQRWPTGSATGENAFVIPTTE